MSDLFTLAEDLRAHGQEHLLVGVEDLDEATRSAYLERLAVVDWAELQHPAESVAIDGVESSRVIDAAERRARADELSALGEAAYAAGKVAILMVAGGMGSRLGYDGPKGCYQLDLHSGKSIYQIQAEKVLSLSRRSNHDVPFLVMTSPVTDSDTRDVFAAHGYFGLKPEQVRFFSQGTVPSTDSDGKVLLKAPGHLLENPDGHGGCYQALVKSGELATLVKQEIEHLVYIQVDNILAPVDDNILVGAAIAEQAEVVTKVLEKANPDEKVGHLVHIGDHDHIVEYTELNAEQTRLKNDDGEYIFRWGSPAMHCWNVPFLNTRAGGTLPLHRSKKPLKAWLDGEVKEVTGWKNERFIFDLVPRAERSIGLVIERSEEFAPVKNATGVDSAESAVQLASDLYTRWLTDNGVSVNLTANERIEISPLYAATAGQFAAVWDGRLSSVSGDLYLEEDEV